MDNRIENQKQLESSHDWWYLLSRGAIIIWLIISPFISIPAFIATIIVLVILATLGVFAD